MKDKKGNKILVGEFMKKWKKGIENVPPLKQTQIQIRSTQITQLGIFLGIIMCIISIKTLWWLLIILLGAFFNTWMSIIGMKQKERQLKEYDKIIMEEIKNEPDKR